MASTRGVRALTVTDGRQVDGQSNIYISLRVCLKYVDDPPPPDRIGPFPEKILRAPLQLSESVNRKVEI